MRFVHLTDPHLTSLRDWRPPALPGKRWSGYLSWRRKRSRQLQRGMLDRLIAAAREENPALLAITGDLAHIGLPQEIRQARDWLAQLGPPERVLLVPGNHDIYARDSWPAVARHWSDYLQLATPPMTGDGREAYPILREIDGVAFVGVSSSLPTAPLLATGRLGAAQLGRLQDMFRDLHRRGAFTCLLIHHPPVTGLTHWRKRLADEGPLEQLMRRERVPIALHGHLHCDLRARRGDTRIYGTASASSVIAATPASYRVIDVERESGGWHVTMTLKRHDAASGAFTAVDRECWLFVPAPD
jgi:3',5'-cyclic AMP phosphodiesterase CpdA